MPKKPETTEAPAPKARKPRGPAVYELEQKVYDNVEVGGSWVKRGGAYLDADAALKEIRDNGWQGEFRVIVVKRAVVAEKVTTTSIKLA